MIDLQEEQMELIETLHEGDMLLNPFLSQYAKRALETGDFGHKLLCQITREDIEEYRNGKVREFSNVCANKHLLRIWDVFAHGTEIRAVINNPSRDVPLLSEKAHVRDTFILPAELENILNATQNSVQDSICLLSSFLELNTARQSRRFFLWNGPKSSLVSRILD